MPTRYSRMYTSTGAGADLHFSDPSSVKQRSAVLHLTPAVVEARVAPVAGMLVFLARTKC